MNILNQIGLWWMKRQNQVYQKPVLYQELKTLLDKLNLQDYEILDLTFMTCDYETLKKVVELMPIKLRKFQSEVHDCDDFAREFWALSKLLFPMLPVGLAIVNRKDGKHAMNIFFYKTKNGTLDWTFIEPQLNKVSRFDYKLLKVIV